jgi:hypothetical protein
MANRNPKEAEAFILRFEDGEEVNVTDLEKEQYEDFLGMMNGLISSYKAVMKAKRSKQNENSNEHTNDKTQESSPLYPLKNGGEDQDS